MRAVVEAGAADWDDAVATLSAVRAGCREEDGQDPLDEAAALRLGHGPTASRLWWAESSGFALLQDRVLALAVAPDARGAGVGSALTATVRSAVPDEPVAAWSHGNHPAAAALAAAYGFDRVRDLWVMRRPATLALPPLPAPRTGITLRSFDGSHRDLDELLRVNGAAFAHHAEQGRLSADDLADRMSQEWFDPAGLLVATDEGGRWLGFHWTKRQAPALGEVYVLGIDPAAQGRGLGRLLTLAGLHHLAGGGGVEVLLYVESDNRPAIALYEGLGFAHAAADTHVMYAGG